MAPPVLEYLASLIYKIAPEIEVELIDANREDIAVESLTGDLILFSALTPQALWVYRTADVLRKIGKKVVIGGMHVTALPEEGKLHADAVVVGEAESVMANLLADAKKGNLSPFYYGDRLSLEGLPEKRRGLLKHKYRFDSFFTARGCPYKCTFCSVRRFFGDTIRYRPIREVVREVASSPYGMLMNIDDNIWGIDIFRSIELFKELSMGAKGKLWVGQGDLCTVQHEKGEEMLTWARRSGLTTVMAGWESNNAATLDAYKAKTKQGRNRVEAIKKIRDNGIDVVLFVMLGGLYDEMDSYKDALEFSDRLDVLVHPVMTIPYPGTDLRSEWAGHITHEFDWDMYDGMHMLMSRNGTDPEEHNRALMNLWTELFTVPRIVKRLTKISWKGFPSAHIASAMFQFAMRRAFMQYT